MTKKNLQISLEDAKELLKTNPFLKQSLEELFPELKDKVKNRWEDLNFVEGYIVITNSTIVNCTKYKTERINKNIFATHSQALSSLAYAQLTQLMKDTGDCEGIDWTDSKVKHTIERVGNKIGRNYKQAIYQPIDFKTESIRNEFFEKHQELLKQYFQIQ